MPVLNLSPIYHVPNLTSNRFSHQFCRKNSCAIDFNGSSMSLKDQRTERVFLQADFSHGLYSISNSIMSSHLHPIMSFSASLIHWVFDRLFGFKFNYSFFWVFEGNLSFSSLPHFVPCVYLGYASHHKSYHCPNPPFGCVFINHHI